MLLLLSLFALIGLSALCSMLLKTYREIGEIETVRPIPPSHGLPRVSLIVAARNEEKKIEAAVKTLLAQDYPNKEVIVVNDRSTDGTLATLERLQKLEPRLRIVTIRELPAGWLGKCHALHIGSQQASGNFFVFIDADVHIEKTTLRRAIGYVEQNKLDHFTILPKSEMPGDFLKTFMATFVLFFSAFFRPWKVRDLKSKAFVGVGAFNLVRAVVYRKAGGHEVIRLRPDDDMKLGKLMKVAGGKSDVLRTETFVTVEWYDSVKELVRGLEKNSFAGVEYDWRTLALGSLAQLTLFVWPFFGLFATSGIWVGVNFVNVCLICVLYEYQAWRLKVHPWTVLLFPATVLLFNFIVWRATWLTLSTGGIKWRGTFYPLAQLRQNKF